MSQDLKLADFPNIAHLEDGVYLAPGMVRYVPRTADPLTTPSKKLSPHSGRTSHSRRQSTSCLDGPCSAQISLYCKRKVSATRSQSPTLWLRLLSHTIFRQFCPNVLNDSPLGTMFAVLASLTQFEPRALS
jgi:hypothetical protein